LAGLRYDWCRLYLFDTDFSRLLFGLWLLCDFLLKVLLEVIFVHLLASKRFVGKRIHFRRLHKRFVGFGTVTRIDTRKDGLSLLFGCGVIVKKLVIVIGGLFSLGSRFGLGLVIVKIIKIKLIVPIRHRFKTFSIFYQ
jgi:hypothetical protein